MVDCKEQFVAISLLNRMIGQYIALLPSDASLHDKTARTGSLVTTVEGFSYRIEFSNRLIVSGQLYFRMEPEPMRFKRFVSGVATSTVPYRQLWRKS